MGAIAWQRPPRRQGRYGKFGKTKAYELIAQERIRAYKMGGKTLIDLDSIDEYHASLPLVESRATL
jgi:excisionase family DNA binding protein